MRNINSQALDLAIERGHLHAQQFRRTTSALQGGTLALAIRETGDHGFANLASLIAIKIRVIRG